MNSLLSACVLLLLASSLNSSIIFSNCGEKANIVSVKASGCNDAYICEIGRNTSVQFNITFFGMEETERLKSVVSAIWSSSFAQQLPLNNANGCECGATCPTIPGTLYTITGELLANLSLPQLDFILLWKVIGNSYQDILCFKSPIVVLS